MKLGVHLVNFNLPGGPESIGPTLAATGAAAEEAGLDNLSFMDHYFQLEFLARRGATRCSRDTPRSASWRPTPSTVELQLLMTGVTYRHPGLLAKIVSTLDVLSGGRAALGIGAAWYEREHRALGVPFPPLAERFERLEETLQIVRQMWSDDNGPFDGKHYQLAETINSPQPLRQPHPPIMVGGGGERKTLRLVAKYADACNVFAGPGTGPDGGRPQARGAARLVRAGRPTVRRDPSDRALQRLGRAGSCGRSRVRRGDARAGGRRRRRGARDAPARRPGRLRQVARRARRAPSLPDLNAPAHGHDRGTERARTCDRQCDRRRRRVSLGEGAVDLARS